MSLDVAVLGATGLVGERLIALLDGHPWFRLREVVASEASAGLRIGDRLDGLEPATAAMRLKAPGEPLESPLLLSALPRAAAASLEPLYARRGHRVASNASAFRADPGVPLVVPEVNAAAIGAVEDQPWRVAGGALVCNPNCMVSGLAIALAPLQAAFGLRAVTVATMQAISGAGRGGPSAWQLQGNVVPEIAGEAEKFPGELHRLLGGEFAVSAATHRVPVLDGHLAAVFVDLERRATAAEACGAIDDWTGSAPAGLPSAPTRALRLLRDRSRPQPRLDAGAGDGMVVSVGGVETDPRHDIRLTVLVHNLIRGAAGGCLLNAELLAQS